MCIAIFKAENKVLSEETLRQCWKNNPDGAGFMYVEEGELIVEKGLMSYKEFRDKYRGHENKRVSLHFRITSRGETNAHNTHPHRVNDSVAFVHNGTITKLGTTFVQEHSDTVDFNEQVLKGLPKNFLSYSGVREMLEEFVGTSRLIFMNNEGKAWIFNAERGDVENEVWYSNDTFKLTVTKYKSKRLEWDDSIQDFKEKKHTTATYPSQYQEAYSMYDDYTEDAYIGYGYDIKRKHQVEELVFNPAEDTFYLKEDLNKELSKTVEICINCDNPLFRKGEQLFGVCKDCVTEYVCPVCDIELSLAAFELEECSNCNGVLNINEIIKGTSVMVGPPFDWREEYNKELEEEEIEAAIQTFSKEKLVPLDTVKEDVLITLSETLSNIFLKYTVGD